MAVILAMGCVISRPDRCLALAHAVTSVWRFFKRHNITFKKNPARGGAATRRRSTGASALDASTGHV